VIEDLLQQIWYVGHYNASNIRLTRLPRPLSWY